MWKSVPDQRSVPNRTALSGFHPTNANIYRYKKNHIPQLFMELKSLYPVRFSKYLECDRELQVKIIAFGASSLQIKEKVLHHTLHY